MKLAGYLLTCGVIKIKYMKTVPLRKYSFLVVLFLIFAISSCEKQEDQMAARDAIVGKWDVVENEVSSTPASVQLRNIKEAYLVNLTRSETFADEVYIYNFFNIGYDFHLPAYVDGKTITISKITLEDYTVRGQGSISEDNQTIEWSYWVEDPYGDEKEYRATYTFIE